MCNLIMRIRGYATREIENGKIKSLEEGKHSLTSYILRWNRNKCGIFAMI